MIITKSPLRISIGGGGTDLKSFYQNKGTVFSSIAIDKYVYISLATRFYDEILLKYSITEKVRNIYDIKNELFREIIKRYSNLKKKLEITSFSEVPSGTGLGSSGSFSCAMIKAFYEFNSKKISASQLAKEATIVERDILKKPIGLQDQYISAYGGFREFKVNKNGFVRSKLINLKSNSRNLIKYNFQLFFLGNSRLSDKILASDQAFFKKLNKKKDSSYADLISLGLEINNAIINADMISIAKIMNIQQSLKEKRHLSLTEDIVKEAIKYAKINGAMGAKLIGAGGTGFLMTLSQCPDHLLKKMKKKNFQDLKFDIANKGTTVLHYDKN